MKRLTGILGICAAAVTLSCGGGTDSSSVSGSYSLRTVNGSNLPYTIEQSGADHIEVINETVVIADGGTFTQQGTARVTQGGVVTTPSYNDAGTYTRTGTAVTFHFNSDNSIATATVSGGTITVATGGFSYVYKT